MANPVFSHIEIYSTTKADVKNPSKWVTEIYVPVMPKVVPVKTYAPAVLKSTEPFTEQALPTVTTPAKIIKAPVKTNEPKKMTVPKAKEEEPSEF